MLPLRPHRDTLIKPVKVEAEGFPKEKVFTKYICASEIENNEDFLEEWRLEAPLDAVPDSARFVQPGPRYFWV